MFTISEVFDSRYQKGFTAAADEVDSDNDEEDIGGIFKKVSKHQQKMKLDKDNMNLTESSLMFPWNTVTKDWTAGEVIRVFTDIQVKNINIVLK